jgi:hypothetical protein
LGSKPSYKYEIADPRVFRIIERKLLDVVGDLPPNKWTGLSRSTLGVGWADVAQC